MIVNILQVVYRGFIKLYILSQSVETSKYNVFTLFVYVSTSEICIIFHFIFSIIQKL